MISNKTVKVRAYNTSKEQYALFQRHCGHWFEHFGLLRFCLYTQHSTEVGGGVLADTSVDLSAMTARIRLAKSVEVGERDLSTIEVAQAAFHEVCEVLLWRLSDAASGYVSWKEHEHRTHEIISTLLSVIWWPWWEENGECELKQLPNKTRCGFSNKRTKSKRGGK